jgi:hypothetical protein
VTTSSSKVFSVTLPFARRFVDRKRLGRATRKRKIPSMWIAPVAYASPRSVRAAYSSSSPKTWTTAPLTSDHRWTGKCRDPRPDGRTVDRTDPLDFECGTDGEAVTLVEDDFTGEPRIVVENGTTTICERAGTAADRPGTCTGLRLSARSNRNQRMSPRAITELPESPHRRR